MTITVTPPISLANVMTELRLVNPGRAYPISLGDADVRALAGIPSGPISLSNLYGKSSYIPLSGYGVGDSASAASQYGAGAVSCGPSVVVSGGSGGNTFLWSFTSNPNGCALSDSTAQTCSVSKSYANNAIGSASATLQCVITDNTAHTLTISGISAYLEWANNA